MTNLNENSTFHKRKRVINDEECEFDLRSILPRLFKAFHRAVLNYEKEVIKTRPNARCRGYEASLLNSKMIESMQDEFANEWRFGKYKRFLLNINEYLFFFKKLDKKGYPMNIKTINSSYIYNQQQGNLFDSTDDGSEPILFFGYQKNKIGEIINPQLVYIDENKIKFTINEKQIYYEENDNNEIVKPKALVSIRNNEEKKAE